MFELVFGGDHGRHDALVEHGKIECRDIEDGDLWLRGNRRGEEDLVDEVHNIGTGTNGTSAGDDESYFFGVVVAIVDYSLMLGLLCVVGRNGTGMNEETRSTSDWINNNEKW